MTTRADRCSLLCLTLMTSALTTTPAGAEWFRLSQGQAFSDGYSSEVSPDGKWVVYTQDAETNQAFEVWSVRLPSGSPVKLSGNLPATGSVTGFAISPDGSRVVYPAQQDALGFYELYSVPIAGPAAAGVKLNDALVAGGDVIDFAISPDSTRVVYWADQQTDTIDELYSVPIAGPASSGVKLNGALVAGGDVSDFAISPDSSRVAYRADQQTDQVLELYSVPIAGPASSGVKLNGALVAGGNVGSLAISRDSSRVVYWADQQTNADPELYSVPIAGPAAAGVKLNGVLVAGGDVRNFAISPDSSRVVYRADQQTDEVFELYSVPLGGPAVAGFKLNGPLGANGDVDSFGISPDSTWVVYTADQELDGLPTGHRAPLDGPAGFDEQIWYSAFHDPAYFRFLPDSSTVAVLGQWTLIDSINRIWTYPLSGTPDPAGSDWLYGQLQANGDCTGFELLPDGSGAVYRADQEVDEQVEIYLLYFPLWGDGFETGDTSRWFNTAP